MKKSYWIYALVAFGMCIGAIFIAGVNPIVFTDPPSIALVLGVPLILLLGIFGPREIVNAFRHTVSRSDVEAPAIRRGIVFFATAQKMVLVTGVLFTLLGILMTLYGISKGRENPVAFYMVVAFQTVLWAIVITLLVTIPCRAALEKKLADIT